MTAQADLDQLVRRLRPLSLRSWASRRNAVRELLVELAALGAPGHPLPELPDHALADAVAVLGHDAICAVGAEGVAPLLRAALARTR